MLCYGQGVWMLTARSQIKTLAALRRPPPLNIIRIFNFDYLFYPQRKLTLPSSTSVLPTPPGGHSTSNHTGAINRRSGWGRGWCCVIAAAVMVSSTHTNKVKSDPQATGRRARRADSQSASLTEAKVSSTEIVRADTWQAKPAELPEIPSYN